MMKYLHVFYSVFLIVLISGCASVSRVSVYDKSAEFKQEFHKNYASLQIPPAARIDTIIIDKDLKKIDIYFNRNLSYMSFRKNNVTELYSAVKNFYGNDFSDYNFSIYTLHKTIEELIPNFYRDKSEYDKSRLPINMSRPKPVIKNISRPYKPVNGLIDKNILVWPSHGWYYNNRQHRWMWQRARLYQTIEDLGPYSYVIPYLMPMLENAGANVFIPRERDVQTNEVIVDDMSENYSEGDENDSTRWFDGKGEGFGIGDPPYKSGVNPFKLGKYRITYSEDKQSTEAAWIPDIPETGEYAVYISYVSSEKSVDDAHYTVNYLGGSTKFLVNQQIGGGTWLYLGEFKFKKGKNGETGSVILTNESKESGKIVSADAVRFGGGMGVIERGGGTSSRPKFAEGSRYWLQFAGMPDTLVYNLNHDTLDYNDDYQNRGEYGNYLYGAPYGPNRDRNVKGLGIPIDLSLAFHTDAGMTKNDTTVGTLAIYSIPSIDNNNKFPDSVSRFANRDLADIVQTQVCDDIRAKYDPIWNRRWLWDAKYSEAMRPNIPSLLLELLSHENFLDTKFNLDPRFRFDVSRAIYKGMLKFLSAQYGFSYVVQPLPVTHFSTEFNESGGFILRWKPEADPLEPSAVPDKYVVYKRIGDGDFDNGIIVNDTMYEDKDIIPGKIYSYKVAAVNDGGESFSSEILSACRMNNSKEPVLIINGFDRICAPASVKTDSFSGYLNNVDAGVFDKYEMSYVGAQYDFDPDSKWITDDNPGHGASHSNYEAKIVAGNTFDYPYMHGKSIKTNGYSFVSCSNEAVWDKIIDISKYKLIDLILGEEKTTHWEKPVEDSIHGVLYKTFPQKFQNVIKKYLNAGGNIFISGAYVGTDLFSKSDSLDIGFAENILKYKWSNGYADRLGRVFSIPSTFSKDSIFIKYNTELNDSIYAVEAPDALYPADGGETILRYSENHFGAGVEYKKGYGVVVFGFPFETILGENSRDEVMKRVLDYLK